MQKYFKTDETYIATKGQSPKGFQGVLCIIYTGPSAGEVSESVLACNQMKKLEEVESVPTEWAEAFEPFGFDCPVEVVEVAEEEPISEEPREVFHSHVVAGF